MAGCPDYPNRIFRTPCRAGQDFILAFGDLEDAGEGRTEGDEDWVCNFADSAFLHPSSIFAPRAFFEVAYTIVARGRTEGAEGGGPKEWLMIWDQVFDDRTHLIRRNGLVTDKTHISVDPPHRWKIPKLGETIRLEAGSEDGDSIDVDSFKPTGRTVTNDECYKV